mmetsp:Transcript_50053/g.133957  ORF Transcript_50053/g.133957 Transcript_50053/m.133957 type:complete len:208 (+) Transcript_50053:261-884(+)
MSSASLVPSPSSSNSSSNSPLQSSSPTGTIPSCRKEPGTKKRPSSVKRTRQRSILAPSLAALAAMSLRRTSSARGPEVMQSWPMQNSTLAVSAPGSCTQMANAEPSAPPMMASMCKASNRFVGLAALSPPSCEAPAAANGTPSTVRNSSAVASSAPFSRMNSSKSSAAPSCLSAIHRLRTNRPCTCISMMGTVTTVLLSLQAPVSVK